MEPIEYERMHAVEDRMWWFRGLHANALAAWNAARNEMPVAGPTLDAGCGTGGLLTRVAAQAGADSALGLDVDPRAADLARRKSG